MSTTSFREFLQEDTHQNLPVFRTVITVLNRGDHDRFNQFEPLKEEVEKMVKNHGLKLAKPLELDDTQFETNIIFSTPGQLAHINEIQEDLEILASHFFPKYNSRNRSKYLEINWPPPFKISHLDRISLVIELLEPSPDFSEISKLVPACKKLIIDSSEKLGGVLSLLNYHGTSYVVFLSGQGGEKIEKLNEIFQRHFTGDKDILACQEELIDAGLEEYAEL